MEGGLTVLVDREGNARGNGREQDEGRNDEIQPVSSSIAEPAAICPSRLVVTSTAKRSLGSQRP